MTDPGLSNRLRQHSRRAGIMVGLSMALTIAICVGGFTTIYARLAPFTSDFVAANTPVPTERPQSTQVAATGDRAEADADAEVAEPTATAPPPPPTPTPTVAPTPTPAFEPDLQSNSELAVNLRQEPGTQANIVTVLTAQTPLQSLAEEQTGPDGEIWIRVRTEEGEEGWIWRNSADPYQPET